MRQWSIRLSPAYSLVLMVSTAADMSRRHRQGGCMKISCLCLLDMSAAVETIGHYKPITRLSYWFGIHGSVLNSLKSYLSSRSYLDMFRPASVSLLCFGLLANVLRLRSVSPIRLIRSVVFGQPVYGQSTGWFAIHLSITDDNQYHLTAIHPSAWATR